MGSDTAIVSNVNIAEEVRMKKKTKKRKRDKEREMETTRAKLSGGGEEVEAEVTVHRVQGAPLIRHIHVTFLGSLIPDSCVFSSSIQLCAEGPDGAKL